MVALLYFMLIAVGFALGGGAAAFWFNIAARKAKNEWRQKRKELEIQIFQLRKQLELEKQLDVTAKKDDTCCIPERGTANLSKMQADFTREKEPKDFEVSVRRKDLLPEESWESKRKALKKTYETFSSCETLSVEFQHSFPDSLLFRPGVGYIRNQQYELIPDQDSIDSVNTTIGYAMDGLFRIFDVIYKSKEYNFTQIQTGAMGHSYVRIQSIITCATIRESGQKGIYVLEKRGKLEVTDA